VPNCRAQWMRPTTVGGPSWLTTGTIDTEFLNTRAAGDRYGYLPSLLPCVAVPPTPPFLGDSCRRGQRLSLRCRGVCKCGRRAGFRGHPARRTPVSTTPPPWKRLTAVHDRGGRSRCRLALPFKRRSVTDEARWHAARLGIEDPGQPDARTRVELPTQATSRTGGSRSLGAAGE